MNDDEIQEVNQDGVCSHLIGKEIKDAFNYNSPYGNSEIIGNQRIVSRLYACQECCKKEELGIGPEWIKI